MTKGVPVIDPNRDLVGATPETLALALLGKPPLRTPAGGEEYDREGENDSAEEDK